MGNHSIVVTNVPSAANIMPLTVAESVNVRAGSIHNLTGVRLQDADHGACEWKVRITGVNGRVQPASITGLDFDEARSRHCQECWFSGGGTVPRQTVAFFAKPADAQRALDSIMYIPFEFATYPQQGNVRVDVQNADLAAAGTSVGTASVEFPVTVDISASQQKLTDDINANPNDGLSSDPCCDAEKEKCAPDVTNPFIGCTFRVPGCSEAPNPFVCTTYTSLGLVLLIVYCLFKRMCKKLKDMVKKCRIWLCSKCLGFFCRRGRKESVTENTPASTIGCTDKNPTQNPASQWSTEYDAEKDHSYFFHRTTGESIWTSDWQRNLQITGYGNREPNAVI